MQSRLRRRRFTLAGAAIAIAALSGCASVAPTGDPTAIQSTPLAPLRFAQDVCVPNTIRDEGQPCGPFVSYQSWWSGSVVPFTTDGRSRLLVAYLLPKGFAPPTVHLAEYPDVTFEVEPDAVSPSLQDRVRAEDSADGEGGSRWVGYRSSPLTMKLGTAVAGGRLYADVPVPRTQDGMPVSTMLGTWVAVGNQVIDDGLGHSYPADRPVVCSERLNGSDQDSVDSTTCPNSPVWTESLTPTDAVVRAPEAPTTLDAGDEVTLPFAVLQAGALAAPEEEPTEEPEQPGGPPELAVLRDDAQQPVVSLEATSTVVDAQATTDTSELSWPVRPRFEPLDAGEETPGAPRSTDVAVTVRVPATTPTGDYDVTLRAFDAGGERTATARIHVVGKPPVVPTPLPTGDPRPARPADPTPPPAGDAPAPAPASPAAQMRLLRTVAVGSSRRAHLGRVACRSAETCSVRTVVALRGRRVAERREDLEAGAERRMTVRLSPTVYRRLRKAGAEVRVTVGAPGAETVTRVSRLRTP